jgi:hypothetical protein
MDMSESDHPGPILRYYSAIFFEGLREITKNSSQDIGYTGPPEFAAGEI